MLRERIKEHCGDSCQILALRRAPEFGCHLFVADFTRNGRLMRLLGSLHKDGKVIEQSIMDLLCPQRLVYAYERMMLVAFALARDTTDVLLLGLGGGAMCRHLEAYLPSSRLTVVEHDAVVRQLAGRHFHIARDVIMDAAQAVVSRTRVTYDVVLVDLYDEGGAAKLGPEFWQDCTKALRPGGCIAINWAEFVGEKRVKDELEPITAAMGRSFFMAEKHSRPNIVQFAPRLRGFHLGKLSDRLTRFAAKHKLPREDRDILKRCEVGIQYPGLG